MRAALWAGPALTLALSLLAILLACSAKAQDYEPLWRANGYNVGKVQDGKVSCYVASGGSVSCVVLP